MYIIGVVGCGIVPTYIKCESEKERQVAYYKE